MRIHYIKTKDVRFGSRILDIVVFGFFESKRLKKLDFILFCIARMTVGTWIVAGRIPDEDLEIDEWLCMDQPADIYILG
ncbi:putative inositol-polyphosphate 5-phosphatase [Helianthus annuus]|nr:putative inositol-polyphosphate 5-phosphatase [Helianthus annuus]